MYLLTLTANKCFICLFSLPTLEELIAAKKQLPGLRILHMIICLVLKHLFKTLKHSARCHTGVTGTAGQQTKAPCGLQKWQRSILEEKDLDRLPKFDLSWKTCQR